MANIGWKNESWDSTPRSTITAGIDNFKRDISFDWKWTICFSQPSNRFETNEQ